MKANVVKAAKGVLDQAVKLAKHDLNQKWELREIDAPQLHELVKAASEVIPDVNELQSTHPFVRGVAARELLVEAQTRQQEAKKSIEKYLASERKAT